MAKASAGEMRLLGELRAKELKDVPPSEFAIIEREVQANGFKGIKGTTAQLVFNAIRKRDKEGKVNKAASVKSGDMVSWQSSGGSAQGKVVRVVSNGKINVPDSSFTITGTEDDPAVLIQLYRDGEPTETKVGHKMSTLKKKFEVAKHQEHDQSSHGNWSASGSPKLTIIGKNDGTNEFFNENTRVVRYQPKGKEPVDYVLFDYGKSEILVFEKPTDGTTINGWGSGSSLKPVARMEVAGPGATYARSSARNDNKATIMGIIVKESHRRRGLASAMLQFHRDRYPELDVQHSDALLDDGKAWADVVKHGNHDQSSHGSWANGGYNPDDSEGEDSVEPKNYRTHPKFHEIIDDSEGEFEDLNYDDPRWMDDMDILRPSRITPSQRYTTSAKELIAYRDMLDNLK